MEHLEDKFYREGLANFTEDQFAAAGFDSTFYTNLLEVSKDESTHVSFLTSALAGRSDIIIVPALVHWKTQNVKHQANKNSRRRDTGRRVHL